MGESIRALGWKKPGDLAIDSDHVTKDRFLPMEYEI
jgi:hypothetical protein